MHVFTSLRELLSAPLSQKDLIPVYALPDNTTILLALPECENKKRGFPKNRKPLKCINLNECLKLYYFAGFYNIILSGNAYQINSVFVMLHINGHLV